MSFYPRFLHFSLTEGEFNEMAVIEIWKYYLGTYYLICENGTLRHYRNWDSSLNLDYLWTNYREVISR